VSPSAYEEAARVEPASRAEWRAWLAVNHAASTGVWLVYPKKASGLPGPSYEEAVEEALCFGWIDSRVRPLDGRRRLQWVSPRRPGSIWSAPNKARVARLLAAGRMAPAGLAKIEAAQADGSWEILDKVEALELPEDLAAALAGAPKAASGFAALAPTLQKQCLYWVLSAKRAQTRAGRVAAVALAAAGGRTPFPSR
jgi:uncharacterized protein YdeI (YjbR/CyaY-like superfamily)